MNSHGISFDEVTMAIIISACARIGVLNFGKEIHLYVMQNEFDLDVYLGFALVDMYAKWLVVHGYAKEALAMFRLIEEGRRRFLNMTCDFSIPLEIQQYGCMVDLLCKAGLIKDALELIQCMQIVPNSVIWGALLSGCKLYNNLEIAQVAVNKLMVLEPNNSGCYTLLVNMKHNDGPTSAEREEWHVFTYFQGLNSRRR
ncbi:Pentatricopeptide repeat-containing protein [Camellia lanceoleosa]|nr:Pentatricopeptide repeat-containing protein [Camellia lanceoleosa]